MIIFGLTVPYEKNVQKTHQYKCHKYAHLVIDLLNIAFKVKFYAIEIDCRGLISTDNSNRLYAFCRANPVFKFNQVDFRHFKKSLSKTAVIASLYTIFSY